MMHRKEANKKVLFAGILIVVLITVIVVLFSISPTERAFAGQAILTGQEATVGPMSQAGTVDGTANSPTVSNPGGILGWGYATLKILDEPFTGAYSCPNSGFTQQGRYCKDAANRFISGWVIVQLNQPRVVSELKVFVRAEECPAPFLCTGDTTLDFNVFASDDYTGTAGTWMHRIEDLMSRSNTFTSKSITFPQPTLVKAVLIGRGGAGVGRPDLIIDSLELTPASCTTEGAITTIGNTQFICIASKFESITCQREGQTIGNRAYCDGTRWLAEGQRVRTRIINADGTAMAVPPQPIDGFCPNANDCAIISLIDTNTYCRENRELDPSGLFLCLSSSLYSCSRIYDGVIQGNFICSNGEWQTSLNCNQENQILGSRAICQRQGHQLKFVSCGEESVKHLACVGTNPPQICDAASNGQLTEGSQEYYCSAPSAAAGQTAAPAPQWARCNEQRLGEGVDNRVVSTAGVVYNDRFVCSKTGTIYAWQPIVCNSCADELPGFCTGSSTVRADTNQFIGAYQDNRNVLVGCTLSQNGCFYDSDGDRQTTPDFLEFDQITPDNGYVCGNNNQLLTCSAGFINLPSDGNENSGLGWMCNNGQWTACTAAIVGLSAGTMGDFECQFVNSRYQWFSVFACNERAKYSLRSGDTQICNGERFVNCQEAETDLAFQSDIAVVKVECDETSGRIVKTELACFDTGINNDNDRDGQANCNDSDCTGTRDRTFHEEAAFMLTLRSDTCQGLNYNILTNPAPGLQQLYSYNQLSICSTDNRQFTDTVQVCSEVSGPRLQQFEIQSLSLLAGTSGRPAVNPSMNPITPARDVVLIYETPTGTDPKQVRVVLTRDVSQQSVNFPLNNFVRNMLDGQGVLIKLDNQYYLLSYPNQPTFSLQNLELRHVPLTTLFNALAYAGTTSYVFNVLGQRQIVVSLERNNIVISSARLGEVVAAYAQPYNLSQQYEITVTKAAPIEITSPATLGLFSICRTDNDADIQQVQICVRNTPIGTLKIGNLTKMDLEPGTGITRLTVPRSGLTGPGGLVTGPGIASPAPAGALTLMARLIPAAPAPAGVPTAPPPLTGVPITTHSAEPVDDEYLLLYEYDLTARQKKVSLFVLAKPTITPADANYNDFINNMIAGRRLGLEFGNELYVLGHGQSALFSLLNVNLTRVMDSLTTVFPAVGSEDNIEAPILGGNKIILQRRYGTPPPPFQLSALDSRQALMPINLNEQLSTVMSSEAAVLIASPENHGIISASERDPQRVRDIFRLRSDPFGEFAELNYRQPFKFNNILFYYHSAQPLGTIQNPRYIKTAALYRVFEVTTSGTPRPFNDQFAQTLTSGKELALAFGSNYYLLSYQGASASTAQFFTVENLRLTTLDKAQTFTPTLIGTEATFTVPSGVIKVELRLVPGNDQMFFRTTTASGLLVGGAYTQQLTLANRITLGGIELRICNEDELYGSVASADVCFSALVDGAQNLVVGVSSPRLLSIQSQHYLLEVNGEIGANKVVNIRRIININNFNSDTSVHTEPFWRTFITAVTARMGPIFNVSGTFYAPAATSPNLDSTFGFREYPIGRTYNLRNVNRITEITANGTFTLGDDVLRVKQEVAGDLLSRVIATQFKLEPYLYLPDDGTALVLNVSGITNYNEIDFVLNVDSKFYRLFASIFSGSTPEPSLVEIGLDEYNSLDSIIINRMLISRRLFAEGDSRIVRMGSQRLEIKVDKIKRDDANQNLIAFAQISVKR